MDTNLAALFAFTKEDLEANRNGYLSAKQLAAFRRDTKETLAVFQVVLCLLPVPILINYFNFNIVLCGFVFALMEAAAILIYQQFRQQARFSLKAGDLKTIEGIVKFRVFRQRRYLHIGNERFLLTKPQAAALSEYKQYRFYFTDKHIWSCEQLSSPKIINE